MNCHNTTENMTMYGTYCRLGLHVSDSDVAVIRAANAKLNKSAKRGPELRQARRDFYAIMLRHHHEARGLYRDVMFNDIGGYA